MNPKIINERLISRPRLTTDQPSVTVWINNFRKRLLDAASQHQQEKQTWQARNPSFSHLPLSEQLASILSSAWLTLIGTEHPLTLPLAHVFLQAAEALNRLQCIHCRLIYTLDSVALEAIAPAPNLTRKL